ncbi:MAG: hypothetical protein Q8W51_15220 [Candidatus Palauibacterales bacterium]|nr:hypothetical protein [Candidatus Palauibacterales bacterium]MDP2531079.1 hypothetical protein [Candidatus Palauibacterales bacterium]MDP2582741.1 hypothetical protein [Candidatus Palauibacterales bacterium]
MEFAESRESYYRVEGVSQYRMLDAPRFWLPQPMFRGWLAGRADDLATEDVESNAGHLTSARRPVTLRASGRRPK